MKTNETYPKDDVMVYELEKARFIMKDATGLDVSYAYEDLVFSEHGIYIIQFHESDNDKLYCFFNRDCIETEKQSLFKSLEKTSTLNGVDMEYKGKFELIQHEGEDTFLIKFMEEEL